MVLMSLLVTTLIGWWWADVTGGFILMCYCFFESINIRKELKTSSSKQLIVKKSKNFIIIYLFLLWI